MIEFLEKILSKRIFYLNIQKDLSQFMNATLNNWVLYVLADNPKLSILDAFAESCIDKDVLYVCTAGNAGSEIDTLFDLNIVMREIDGRKMPSWYGEDDTLMTSWHAELEEGFWFATNVSFNDRLPVEPVLVVNMTDDNLQSIIADLTRKISSGWIPPD